MRLPTVPHGDRVTIQFEGNEVDACAGETVAVALFGSGKKVLSQSVKYHRPRGFFCLAGSCGACLTRIDGKPNMKACRAVVREGMTVERQNAFPTGGFDVLGAADFFFAKGMDHHTMMTSPRALNAVMQKVVRQLAGLGRLPDVPPSGADLKPAESRHVDVAVVGGGPAGLAAAAAIARAGRKVLVIEEQDRAGGSYLAHPAFGVRAADEAVRSAQAAGAEILVDSTAFAWFPEDGPRGLMAVHTPRGLLKLTADRTVYATGAYDQNALFVDNDRPGVLSARAVGRLLVRFGVRAGARPLVVGDGPYARALETALRDAGAEVTRIDGVQTRIGAAVGLKWVKAADVVEGKQTRRVKCDVIAVAALPAPASELPRQHGAAVELREAGGGFACVIDDAGRTRARDVWACGDVAGFVGPELAASLGAKTGEALVRS